LPEVENHDKSEQSITVPNENIVNNTDVFSAGSINLNFFNSSITFLHFTMSKVSQMAVKITVANTLKL
jgi:hypothetical protein